MRMAITVPGAQFLIDLDVSSKKEIKHPLEMKLVGR